MVSSLPREWIWGFFGIRLRVLEAVRIHGESKFNNSRFNYRRILHLSPRGNSSWAQFVVNAVLRGKLRSVGNYIWISIYIVFCKNTHGSNRRVWHLQRTPITSTLTSRWSCHAEYALHYRKKWKKYEYVCIYGNADVTNACNMYKFIDFIPSWIIFPMELPRKNQRNI